MPKTITIKSNAKDFVKILKKRHGALPIVASETVNTGAELVARKYKKSLNTFTLRNKFTKGAVRIQKSRPQGRGGDFRPIADINAIAGVLKMKGGKDHYLKSQEVGDTKRGKTKGSVAIPLVSARISKSSNKPISGPLRLKRSTIQTLRVGSKKLGVPGSAYRGRQAWAILYKYSGASRKHKDIGNPYGWDMGRQFFFTGVTNKFGVFKKKGKRFTKTRTLDRKTVKVKALHKFQTSFDKLTPKLMDTAFKRNAQKYIRGK